MREWLAACVLGFAVQGEAVPAVQDDFTQRITSELRGRDPEAAELFTRANAARERADHVEAERLYRATFERATGRKLPYEEIVDLDFIVARAAIAHYDLPLLQECVRRLEKEHPDEPATHYFAWTAAIALGNYDEAKSAIERAAVTGMPAENVEALEAATAHPWVHRLLSITGWIALVWASVLVLLLAAGLVLSGMTLGAAQRLSDQPSGELTGVTRTLRRIYQVVLWLCSAYYYVSIPLVLVMVVGLGGAILYGFYELGSFPVKPVVFVIVAVSVTVWAALKSLWVAGRDEDPGELLYLEQEPRLFEFLDEVAERIGTRTVDSVYLTPGTEIAVTERGGLRKQLQGNSERCLILGLGVFDGLRLGPFRAVLAHEFGHFQNRDTAGGGFALAVRRSLMTMAVGLAQGGVARIYNPAWLFLNGFNRVFLRVSQGASRLQEMMADRWAAFAYGSQAFEQGLRHVIERGVRFQHSADRDIRRAIEEKQPLTNLYASAGPAGDEPELERAIAAVMNARPSPYDSHPAPKDRFSWVHALSATPPATEDAEQGAWSLFSDPLELQTRMTNVVRMSVVRTHHVRIKG